MNQKKKLTICTTVYNPVGVGSVDKKYRMRINTEMVHRRKQEIALIRPGSQLAAAAVLCGVRVSGLRSVGLRTRLHRVASRRKMRQIIGHGLYFLLLEFLSKQFCILVRRNTTSSVFKINVCVSNLYFRYNISISFFSMKHLSIKTVKSNIIQ